VVAHPCSDPPRTAGPGPVPDPFRLFRPFRISVNSGAATLTHGICEFLRFSLAICWRTSCGSQPRNPHPTGP